jgi:RND superfamily putative drug exporter
MPRAARWLAPLLLLLLWLGAGAVCGPYAGRLGEVSTNDQAAFLPRSAESTRVLDERERFDREESLPAVLVWTAEGGGRLGAGAREAATRALGRAAGADGVLGRPSPALLSKDGRAIEGVVSLRPGLGDRLPGTLEAVRAQAETVPGTVVGIAGPAAAQADLSDAFAGIDGILLGVALVAVLLILLLVYRSVLMPFLVILSAVFALAVASAFVYVLAEHEVVRVDGQVRGILSILVIGAATDYALLLTARFREELTRYGDRFVAVRAALHRSAGAIAASGATVALGLLALLLSDLTNNRALGPVGALGIGCAVLSTFTFLPAVLVLLGRAAYWPRQPASDAGTDGKKGVWQRVACWVDRFPRRLWVAMTVVLLGLAVFAPTLRSSGVPLDETFVGDASSVSAQRALDRHFPGGSGQPVVILTGASRADAVVRAARGVSGVASVVPVGAEGRPGGKPQVAHGRVEIDATLRAAPDTGAAKNAVRELRTAVREAGGGSTRVGGYTAQQIDTEDTAAHDRTLIVPVVLLIILVILFVLLRAFVLPAARRDGRPQLRGDAGGLLARLPVRVRLHGDGRLRTALRFRLPRRARGGLQHLPDVPRPGGDRAPRTSRGRPARSRLHRRCHHLGGRRPRRDLRGPRGHPAVVSRPDRLHRRVRRPHGHARGPLPPGSGTGAGTGRAGVVAGQA